MVSSGAEDPPEGSHNWDSDDFVDGIDQSLPDAITDIDCYEHHSGRKYEAAAWVKSNSGTCVVSDSSGARLNVCIRRKLRGSKYIDVIANSDPDRVVYKKSERSCRRIKGRNTQDCVLTFTFHIKKHAAKQGQSGYLPVVIKQVGHRDQCKTAIDPPKVFSVDPKITYEV